MSSGRSKRFNYTNDALFIKYMSGREAMWDAATKSSIHDMADVLKRVHPKKYIAFKVMRRLTRGGE